MMLAQFLKILCGTNYGFQGHTTQDASRALRFDLKREWKHFKVTSIHRITLATY